MPLPTPTIKVQKGHALRPHEVAARMSPGGRMPINKAAKADPNGEAKYTQIGDASPAAQAASMQRWDVKHKPDLVAKRAAKGK
jgi:hypothetical protein